MALAVLARSMKEGQYYMTPLYLICLPLILLTLMPEIELNLFYSLVPITGVALLLRALIMGDYQTAVRFFLPVMVPTIVYAAIALRWAIDQFEREEVLFREAERFNLAHWLKHLIRDRQPMPTGGQAMLCFSLILTASWFSLLYMARRGIGATIAGAAAGQFLILLPPLIMAVMLTSSPRRTLRLYWPAPRYLALAFGFVLAVNPLVNELRHLVESWFPISSVIKQSLSEMMSQIPNIWVAVGCACLLAGHLRGGCIPWVHSLRSGISAADPFGDRVVGAHVRVPPCAHEPVPAAFQCHRSGSGARTPRGSQPKLVARHRVSLPEQRAWRSLRHRGCLTSSRLELRLGSIALRPRVFIMGSGSHSADWSLHSCFFTFGKSTGRSAP